MLSNEPSFTSLLVKKSLGMHFGHAWIAGKDGKCRHPCHSQAELLADLSTIKQGKPWLLKVLQRLAR